MKNSKKYKNAFSLAEILLSVTIVAIILLLAMPVITKLSIDKLKKGGSEAAEFYYNETNNSNSQYPCYITTTNSGNQYTYVTENAGECQAHDFTIPNGVHKIDIVLVAGGGGGGGAGGGHTYIHTLRKSDSDFSFNKNVLKKAKIDILTGLGTYADATTRQGGNSGTAIIDFVIPNSFILQNTALNYFNTDFNASTTGSGEAVTASLNIETVLGLLNSSAVYIDSDFTGMGLGFSGLMQDGSTTYNSVIFVSDGQVKTPAAGSEPEIPAANKSKVMCALNLSEDVDLAQKEIFTGKDISSSDAITSTLCKLNPVSYKATVEGGMPQNVPDGSTSVTSGAINAGGKGGENGSRFSEKGRGQDGTTLVYNCFKEDGSSASNKCNWVSGYSKFNYETKESGARYGEITLEIEQPGSGGTGGVGGSAVKIKDLAVKSGATYKIVVGKGGSGGSAGRTGVNPSVGTQGSSGSSTAIYDDEGNLVVMVIGGLGGFGGNNSDTTSASAASSMTPQIPSLTRNTPLVILGKNYADLIVQDDDFAEGTNVIDADYVSIDASGGLKDATPKRLIYSFMKKSLQPLYILSTKYTKGITSSGYEFSRYNQENNTNGDRRMGGFSQYGWGALTSSLNSNNVFFTSDQTHNGTTLANVYSGFYYRYPTSNSYYYAGGLGGFSGLGSKAGCGGGFVGNYEGLYYYIHDTGAGLTMKAVGTNSAFANTVSVTKNDGGTQKAQFFIPDEFFEGCSLNTTDGHSAKFIAPTVANGKIENYGQAGAGGGGGGYNINLGAGKGADGQNGYAVVLWKK